MKNLFFALALVGMILTSCGPKEFHLSTQNANRVFSEKGQTDSVVINGSDGTCKIEYAPEWLNAEVNDSVVFITLKANDTGKIRKDVVVVKCGASNIGINIEQGTKATHLELPNGNKIKLGKEGGTQELVIVTDGFVKVKGFDGVDAKYENGKLIVSSPKNEGNRIKGVIKITAGAFSKEVNVTVEGKVCPTCKGTGTIRCKACGGKGNIPCSYPDWDGCPACGGRGYCYRVPGYGYRQGKGKVTCPTCKGKGV